ncbi:MAG: hypothetical protein ABI120_01775, partial [Gemmatimonadaceae bacterium]
RLLRYRRCNAVAMLGLLRETETMIGAALTSTMADPLFDGSATRVARTVSRPDEVGTVYNPPLLITPTLVLPLTSRLQVTSVFVEPVTVAKN